MLKVDLVVVQRGWGGGEEQARLLAHGLRQSGHDCRILARKGTLFAHRLADEGFPVEVFAGRGRSPRTLWQLRRVLRERCPDVLHLNDSHAVTAAGMAALGLKIPARIAARRTFFPLRSSLQYRRLCDRLICVAEGVANLCRDAGIPSEMLRVVYDGADPAFAQTGDRRRGRAALAVTDDQPLLVCVANLLACKGHDVLLAAMAGVLQQHPRAVLALAGRGPLRPALEQQARQAGIESQIRFLDFRDDVPDLVQAADLFVLPSRLEGLGSVLIEVMLGGRPIVTTTAGGIPDLLGRDEQLAWTVPPDDAPALAQAILSALEDPAERTRRAERAYQKALHTFTVDHMVAGTLAVYEELLGRHHEPASAA